MWLHVRGTVGLGPIKPGCVFNRSRKRYTNPMTPQEALELINASEHTAYTLNAQYSGGEDQGAFQVVNTDGTRAVLKINRNPAWVSQVNRAKAATAHLKPLGYPVPTYTLVGSTDRGTYSLQTELTGINESPTPERMTELLKVIDLQKGQLISEVQGQDWVWYITDVVFRGESGHVRAMMQFSAETSAVVAEIEGLVAGLQGKALVKDDLVHGDMGVNQILWNGNAVAGVLDWDQVGYGDRTIDLVSLWYSIMQAPEARDTVMKHMLEISDKVKICAAYKMLTMVAWNITKGGGDVAPAAMLARTATELLRAL
jgi:aminoglycoside phosphotransferase (APT) family kinase protein